MKEILAVLFVMAVIFVSGCTVPGPGPGPAPFTIEIPSITGAASENPKLALAGSYLLEGLSINASPLQYQLPLSPEDIVNWNNVSYLGLDSGQQGLLQTNGFAVIPRSGDDMVAPYKAMKELGIPIFVTTDTLLHLYHIQFDEILKNVEEREFFGMIKEISRAMLDESLSQYSTYSGDLKEAAKRNVAYFAVGLKLLDPTAIVPLSVSAEVNAELQNIEAHQGFSDSAIFNSVPYPPNYMEDYSQYVPRGHYTRSENLKKYFKAMMWYGRMAFFLKGGQDAMVSEYDAKIATIQASLISARLPSVETSSGANANELWNRIYSVTAFFAGTADDLTPYEYLESIKNVFGSDFNVTELEDENKLLELKAELAQLRSPEIYGGSGVCVIYPPFTADSLNECLDKTKGLRFMGQRFIPDSYMFQNLVLPKVGGFNGTGEPFTMCVTAIGSKKRCFPRGLDVMAVLGSDRAYDILKHEGDTDYSGLNTSYDQQLELLRQEFSIFNLTDWNRNLYWSWLYALKPLIAEFDTRYPTFMQTQAWQDKELQTALASWAELRHDTILYAKQSYTPYDTSMPEQPKPVVGYVEPVPEFYARLLALVKMTDTGLTELNVLNSTEKARLESLESVIERIINITKMELENTELSDDDYEFIRNFGQNLDVTVTGVDTEGKETTIIADVHTDTNTEQVLEEGVGKVDLVVVAYKVPDGRVIIGAGPVFSYYEFKHPMNDRLTDEKWKEMLQDDPPERPGWISSFYA